MEWFFLALIACVYCSSAYLSYNQDFRRASWYWPTCVVMGLLTSGVWYAMVKYLDNKQRIYVYSLCWDTVMCCSFYLVPVFFFGGKLDRWAVFGLILMLVGLAVLKIRVLGS